MTMMSSIFTTSSLSAELAESSIDDSHQAQGPASRPKLPAMTTNLESLVARRKWNRLRSLLSSADFEVYAKNSSRDILHILYASNPPLDIVTDLLGLCGSRVSEIDSTGRTPLHMATASGASVEVVEPLISMYPTAAGIPDNRGETPLMLASAHGKGADKSLIKALIRASPNTVIDEDDEGMSSLEYALLSEVPRDIFRMLQKSCAKERKRRDEKAKKARAREALRLTSEAQQAAANIAAQQTTDAITELAAINMAAKNVKLSSRRQVFASDVHNSTRTLNRNNNSSSNESIRSLTGRAA
mmetsp:Transcript_20595/g.59052  ORF Transcript_20595/g.59052 Transcript_20595/m.59052 type:complete len:300 (+) Transcript_20595:102-1001(+)|eukprot:CAMPEP_0181057106 /NCGR_PEP_ID=MMETSP1070-20121207/20068_1 /TAXON_ID=265543 /ORGANISM="Minutocellus polymorphus, Strain NH13" /LENGTH=299 /DNA_ID=CAMNT_0023136487 /DNA_START=33 /DNA_END=932 /DNA_ORIENTATION=-